MNSSEILNLNAPSVAKRPATKHFSNVHSTLVFLPVESSIYFNADRISRISINPPPLLHSFFFDPTHNSLFNSSDSYSVPFSS